MPGAADEQGLLLSVRPSLIPQSAILAQVQGAYNAIWLRGLYGEDTFYYGRGAGLETDRRCGGQRSDACRAGDSVRQSRASEPVRARAPGGVQAAPGQYTQVNPYYLRFRVEDKAGIIASLATILAKHHVGIDAVLQLPSENWRDLPFVVTTEPALEQSVRDALLEIRQQIFWLSRLLPCRWNAGSDFRVVVRSDTKLDGGGMLRFVGMPVRLRRGG